MKKYLLKQDLFNHKAGEEIDEDFFSDMNGLYSQSFFMDIYTRLNVIEEIDEEWKPQAGERFFFVDAWGNIRGSPWTGDSMDGFAWSQGNVHRTEEDAKACREKQIASNKKV